MAPVVATCQGLGLVHHCLFGGDSGRVLLCAGSLARLDLSREQLLESVQSGCEGCKITNGIRLCDGGASGGNGLARILRGHGLGFHAGDEQSHLSS